MDTIKELLDDYYGDCRDDDHKEEIVNFINNYWFNICYAMKKKLEDES